MDEFNLVLSWAIENHVKEYNFPPSAWVASEVCWVGFALNFKLKIVINIFLFLKDSNFKCNYYQDI